MSETAGMRNGMDLGAGDGMDTDDDSRLDARSAAAIMSEDELDPVIHAPARLRLMVTLATLREGDNLSFTRLQEMIGLTPGNLITHLRKLDDAGYVRMEKASNGGSPVTAVSLTRDGRIALDRYTTALRKLLDTPHMAQP
jgi:DNA-binding MarR family transcriptional regulator